MRRKRKKRKSGKNGEGERGRYKGEWNLCGKRERNMKRMAKKRKIVEG